MAKKASVKRRVPTVDLIKPSTVPTTASAMKPLIGTSLSAAGTAPATNLIGAQSVPQINPLAPSAVPTIDSLSQQVTQQEIEAALGPISVTQNGKTRVSPAKVTRKKK